MNTVDKTIQKDIDWLNANRGREYFSAIKTIICDFSEYNGKDTCPGVPFALSDICPSIVKIHQCLNDEDYRVFVDIAQTSLSVVDFVDIGIWTQHPWINRYYCRTLIYNIGVAYIYCTAYCSMKLNYLITDTIEVFLYLNGMKRVHDLCKYLCRI